MKDKTKIAFLLTLLMLSGVNLTSCANKNDKEIQKAQNVEKVVADTNDTIASQQITPEQTKQIYQEATKKVQSKRVAKKSKTVSDRPDSVKKANLEKVLQGMVGEDMRGHPTPEQVQQLYQNTNSK